MPIAPESAESIAGPSCKSSGGPGTLYVVAGPIGNLEDITLRAIRVLREVDFILAEDTRVARKLLQRYGIQTPSVPYHAHSKQTVAHSYLNRIASGENAALLTDAGTPGVSDPGAALIGEAVDRGIPVTPVPGPSAITALLSVSSIAEAAFTFEGYPPRRGSDRLRFFAKIASEPRAVVFFEAPHRIGETLTDLAKVCPDRKVIVGRELTKQHEEIFRGSVADAAAAFTDEGARGEFTLLLEPMPQPQAALEPDIAVAEKLLRESLHLGMSGRDALRLASAVTGAPRRRLYALLLQVQGKPVTRETGSTGDWDG